MSKTPALAVSVVIANHNYGDYVRHAIDSALALDWPQVQVIVVDDGSTDQSRAVILGYADRVTTQFQANAGQVAACNAGYAHVRGDVVIFLDADDVLHPELMRELAKVWRHGVSKVQFQMRTIDAHGRPLGTVFPQFRRVPSPEEVRRWCLTAASYPTPPGSGNAYARGFLEQIFPLDPALDRACDSFCLAAAPYLGDVVTVALPLVDYRIHGRNMGATSSLDPARYRTDLQRAMWRFAYAQGVAQRTGVQVPDRALRRSLSALPYRLASLRLAPAAHPVAGDTRWKIMGDMLRALWVPQGVSATARVALLLWSIGVTLAPRTLAERLILWRFTPASRPRVLRNLLGAMRIVRTG